MVILVSQLKGFSQLWERFYDHFAQGGSLSLGLPPTFHPNFGDISSKLVKQIKYFSWILDKFLRTALNVDCSWIMLTMKKNGVPLQIKHLKKKRKVATGCSGSWFRRKDTWGRNSIKAASQVLTRLNFYKAGIPSVMPLDTMVPTDISPGTHCILLESGWGQLRLLLSTTPDWLCWFLKRYSDSSGHHSIEIFAVYSVHVI